MNATVTGWSQLPPDIIRVIVGYLSGSDLGAARLVNKQWAVEGARATRRICLRLKEHQDVAGVASITRALKKAAAGAMPSVKDQLLTAWHVFPEARHVSLRLPHCWDNQGVTGRVVMLVTCGSLCVVRGGGGGGQGLFRYLIGESYQVFRQFWLLVGVVA